MIVLFLLLALILFFIIWIMFVPVYLRINTDIDQCEVSQAGTLRISFHPSQSPALNIRVFGFRVPTGGKKRVKASDEVKGGKPRAIKRSPAAWRYLARGILRGFRVNRLVCMIDLDDVVLSAKLVPFIMLINRGPVEVSTNFTNRNFLLLEMEGRINKVLWTILRFFTKK